MVAEATAETPGVVRTYRQECRSSDGREAFGFTDNTSQPSVEGSGLDPSDTGEKPIRAGEFILGYLNESSRVEPMPHPYELGRNGTYLVIRKLQQRVPELGHCPHADAAGHEAEELLAAKIMLAPERDDPPLGADHSRNNDFGYRVEDDDPGFKCTLGSHIRRINPRDAEIFGNPRTHRLIRREANCGPPLPEGVPTDDSAERGMLFACIGASLRRQFEFVQQEWVNSGIFLGHNGERDPLCGANNGTGVFTIPERPIRRRIHELPTFIVTRGGEYFFMPGLSALRWLADQHR
jgi:deferrochelatase/peroxidase EfeB